MTLKNAYDMLWKEGLLIDMHLFNWIMDFLNRRAILVKLGA